MPTVFGSEMQDIVKRMSKTLSPREATFEVLARDYAPIMNALKSEVGQELCKWLMDRFTESLNAVASLDATNDDKIRLTVVKELLVHFLKKISAYEDGMNKLMEKQK